MIGLLTIEQPVNGHHSQIGAYDTASVTVLRGTITRVRLASPHSLLVVDTGSAETETALMQVESHARPLLIRLGLTMEVLKVGRRVVVRGHPSKSWPEGRVFATSLEFEDGSIFALDLDRVLIPLAD